VAEPETDELRAEQIQRERAERARARSTEDPTEEHQHVRRADRAEYLRERLEERAKSEERVDDEA